MVVLKNNEEGNLMKIKNTSVRAINSEHWESFYANNRNLSESTFCTEIRREFEEGFIVVDIGCGSGRDSFSFAAAGLDVYALDRSYEAIKANKQLAEERAMIGKLSFEQMDLSDAKKLNHFFDKVVKQADLQEKKIVFYLRFLLHAIDEQTEKVLLDTLTESIPSGSFFAAEFRTLEDEEKSKIYDDHYRRFICTDKFLKNMKDRGFSIKEFYKGTGLSIYKEEDPFLARVIAEKI